MSDDLVKHLRSFKMWIGMIDGRGWEETAPYEAASRIEKLEAALIDILKVPRSEASWGIALVIARKALEGKDE